MTFKDLKNIVGDGDYFDDCAHLNAYCYDATRERYKPDCVVFPRDEAQVSKILKFCNDNKIAVTPRGAGSAIHRRGVAKKWWRGNGYGKIFQSNFRD